MSNICKCPSPPGGTIQCSDEQLAICGYRDGQIVSGCFDRPARVRTISDNNERNVALANWALSQIVGVTRSDDAPLGDRFCAMLATGHHRNEETGEVIKFSLPKDLDLQSAAKWTKPIEYPPKSSSSAPQAACM